MNLNQSTENPHNKSLGKDYNDITRNSNTRNITQTSYNNIHEFDQGSLADFEKGSRESTIENINILELNQSEEKEFNLEEK